MKDDAAAWARAAKKDVAELRDLGRQALQASVGSPEGREATNAFIKRLGSYYEENPLATVHSAENADLVRMYDRMPKAGDGSPYRSEPSQHSLALAKAEEWATGMRELPWEFAQSEEGLVRMDHSAAEKHVREHNMRLPSPYELAKVGESHGAKGVVESAYFEIPATDERVAKEIQEKEADGYRTVYASVIDPATKKRVRVVDFYYDYRGYKRPPPPEGNYYFWSSSVHPDHANSAYGLVGSVGRIVSDYRSYVGVFSVRGVRLR